MNDYLPMGEDEVNTRCEICGELKSAEMAEMYDPTGQTFLEGGSVYCHAQCGLSRGYEVA